MHLLSSLIATVLVSFIAAFTDAEEIAQGNSITPPENWYQVEVIFFSHPGVNEEEEAPSNSEFKYPSNLNELIDPKAREKANFLKIEGALIKQENNKIIKNISDLFELVYFGKGQSINESGDLLDLSGRRSTAKIVPSSLYFDQLIPPEPWVAEYENPYELLNPNYRALNDSARGLDRRKYNVLFHEAWRFIADDKINENWLVIGAGKKYLNRYELEGSFRFYKSRFLHFEADLWRIKVSNDESLDIKLDMPKIFELPSIPNLNPISEDSVSWRIRPTKSDANIETGDRLLTASTENFAVPTIVDLIGANYILELHESGDQSLNEVTATDKIEALSVWPIRHSKRIEEGEIYYLDHPEIGIMVLVKNYLPKPLNVPSTHILKAEDSE